jgi:hypothetical protein
VRNPVDKAEGEFPTEVEVRLKDGRRFATSISMPAGSLAAPFTDAQLWAKFDGCAAGLIGPTKLRDLRNALEKMPQLDAIAPIMQPLGAPFAF